MINLVLDTSLLDLYQLCAYKYNIRQNKLKVPASEAVALDRGTIIHAGKEAYFKELKTSHDWNKALQAQSEAVQFAGAKSSVIMVANSEEHISVGFIDESLKRESLHHRLDDLNMEILEVESPFMYVLFEDKEFNNGQGIKFVVIGKIDLLINWKTYKMAPMDHKSHERDYGPPSRFRNQFINYAYALQSYYLFVNRIGLQKTLKDNERFKRVPLSYDPVYFQQWKENTIAWFWKYYESITENQWLQNLTSCDKFNRACEYLPICDTSGESNKVYKLNVSFADGKKWDVSEALKRSE